MSPFQPIGTLAARFRGVDKKRIMVRSLLLSVDQHTRGPRVREKRARPTPRLSAQKLSAHKLGSRTVGGLSATSGIAKPKCAQTKFALLIQGGRTKTNPSGRDGHQSQRASVFTIVRYLP